MVGWNAGGIERCLSGVESAGRRPTAERQQGAVLRLYGILTELERSLIQKRTKAAGQRLKRTACRWAASRYCLHTRSPMPTIGVLIHDDGGFSPAKMLRTMVYEPCGLGCGRR
jgi:hypothetical protein